MPFRYAKLFLIFFIPFFIVSSAIAQVVEEEEEEMPVFEDHPIDESESMEPAKRWPETMDTVRFSRGYKKGFVCNKTEVLIPFEYSALPEKFSKLMVATKNGKTGVINAKNEIIVPFEYGGIKHKSNFFLVYKNFDRRSKYGILDLAGNLIIPIEFESISTTVGNVKMNGKVPVYVGAKEKWTISYYFDAEGQLLKETPYRQYIYLTDQYIHVIGKDYRHGIVTPQDSIVLACEYNKVYWAIENIACVKKDRQMFLIDLETKKVHNDEYKHYYKPDLNNNLIAYKYINKVKNFGLVNLKNEVRIPFSDHFILHIADTDMYSVWKGRKIIGIVDSVGKPIPEFENYPLQIHGLRKGFFIIESAKNKWTVFKKDRSKLNLEEYSKVKVYHPAHKYPVSLDITKLLGQVTFEGQQYYLFMDGTKVEKLKK